MIDTSEPCVKKATTNYIHVVCGSSGFNIDGLLKKAICKEGSLFAKEPNEKTNSE